MTTATAVQRIIDWDWRDKHIQTLAVSGRLINSKTTLLAAGPPTLGDRTGINLINGARTFAPNSREDLAYPIGGIDNVTVAQQQQITRLLELGSDAPWVIAGDSFGSLTINRVLYHGPNLLKTFYAYYSRLWNQDFQNMLNWYEEQYNETVDCSPVISVSEDLRNRMPEIKVAPGFGNFFIDLSSDLFKQPFGLALLMKDTTGYAYGGVYFENAIIGYHGVSFPRGAIIVMEQARIEFSRARGIQMFARSAGEAWTSPVANSPFVGLLAP